MTDSPESSNKEINVLLISPLEGNYFQGETASVESVIRASVPVADYGEPINIKFRTFNQDNLGDLDLSNVPESHVIVSGSDKSIHDAIPHKEKIGDVIQMVRDTGKKLLGICWGHQFIVEKLGGEVFVANEYPDIAFNPEFGMIPISLTREGKNDPAFRGIKTKSPFYMTHFDRVKEPPSRCKKVEMLAKSEMFPNQVFRIDNHILTTQMHPELNSIQVVQLMQKTRESLLKTLNEEEYNAILDSVRDDFRASERNGRIFMHNFYLGPIKSPKQLVLDFSDEDSAENEEGEKEIDTGSTEDCEYNEA